ncbi:MAG: ATP-binding cassette domain-containing protein [Tepidisphaeraceae bacterium]|jgi:phospholipid/cholesterol/gamma-HCH transport system ATP-binding protein
MDPEAPHSDPLEIRVVNLYKSFGTTAVLRGINLSVSRGEMIAIVGGSGSGKTVLMQHLIGHLRADSGEIWLADHELPGSPLVDLCKLDEAGMDQLRIHWAVVFQGNGLFSGTVEYNISLALEFVKGMDEKEAHERSRRAVEAVGLNPDEILGLEREELSGGMAKRVAIARALALKPLLIFYDEPTTGLDPHYAELIQDLIFQTHQKEVGGVRRTSLIITHDKDLLRRLRPRVVMLHDGVVFFDGTYESFQQSDSPVIRPYFDAMPGLQKRPVEKGAG